MPELPEVETTVRGISPHLLGQTIQQVVIREPRLRWPVDSRLNDRLRHQRIDAISRRAKYILISAGSGTLLLHLGMSGSLRILPASTAAEKHDHIDLILANAQCLRFNDPRRFGCLLWTGEPATEHPLLATLGPEPLSSSFDANWLYQRSRKKKTAVKNFLMDGRNVVGVGNIYASESLFLAGIHPARQAGTISRKRYQRLVDSTRSVLSRAIEQGGTTLRDFTNSDGQPGYFAQELLVYGREGESCKQCGHTVSSRTIGQRSSYYCPRCQR